MTVAVKDESSFHQLFQSLPLDEKLIEEYSCSYNEGGSVSIGRLYISQYHVSYAPKIGSTQIIIPMKDISSILKKNSVYLFPNAIEILTLKDQKYFFSAFLSRDLAFATLTTILNAGGGTKTKIIEDMLAEQEQKLLQSQQPLKSSQGDDLTVQDLYNGDDIGTSYSSSRTSSTSSSDEPTIVEESNGSRRVSTPPANTTSPLSQSPSTKMLNSKQTDNNVDNNINNHVEQQQQQQQQEQQQEQSSQEQQPKQGEITEGETNNNNSNSSNASSYKPLPVTPKKQIEREGSMNLTETKDLKSSGSIPRENSSTSLNNTPVKQPQPQNTTPGVTRRNVNNNNNPSKSNESNNSSNSNLNHNNSSGNLSAFKPAAATTTTSNVQKESTLPVSSPSPSSVASTAVGISFQQVPLREKCDHISLLEFDEQPWMNERFPITVEEFYSVIIKSDFWAQVNTTHGYTEQSVSEWKHAQSCCIERNMDFRTAIAFKIGPKSTRVAQTQRCRLRNKDELVFETSSVSRDVPYGDSFSVENLLQVHTAHDDHTSCVVKLSAKIKFTKTLWGITSMIQKSASQGNKEFFILWISMVRNQIEAYAFNKLKSQKSAAAAASSAAAIPSVVPSPGTIPASVTSASIPSPIPQPSATSPKDISSSNAGITPSSIEGGASGLVSPNSISLKTLWDNLKSSEKQLIYGIIGIVSFIFFCLIWSVMSSSSTAGRLNKEIYKFSDSIVLLDSKLNAMMHGNGEDQLQDRIVITPTNLGGERIDSLQRQMETASLLLQRTQSLLSSLQGELAIEALKIKNQQNHPDLYTNQQQEQDSIFSSFTTFVTVILIIAPCLYFGGNWIKSKIMN